MRFSFWPAPMQPWADVVALARHVEATGWDGIWYADHFMPNAPDTSTAWPECWSTLAALAAAVPRLRIGPLVTGNTYRHPAVLAKMAATIDHISGGRLVLGLGAGWQENEHLQYGLPFYTTAERLARLEEACQVIKGLYAPGTCNFTGKYYQLDNASCEPKPLQSTLPLLIGGGGEKVTLRITAKYADEWNVWGTVETLKSKIATLNDHCQRIGRDPATIQKSAVALLFMNTDEQANARMRERPMQQAAIIGTPSEVKAIVAEYAAAGVDELIVPDFTLGPMPQKLATLDTFMRDVAAR